MDRKFNSCSEPAIWGGIECTINRVGNVFQDQLILSGHYDRSGDIAEFASLGFSKMRYPILWERHAPAPNQSINWSLTAARLDELRHYNIDPIAGLVHHGSGPAYTNLLDPDFGSKLAAYALAVSKRFPFLANYTPVNEPLTTARFSGLYGFWYPHCRDDRSFFLMLLNQLKGVVLSMEAIRSVNPDARLIQTEDIGKTHSTKALSRQAEFENNRRWLTYDILCGQLLPGHALWNWIVQELKIPEKELRFFADSPCRPDVLGLNYYVTSERWLDEDLNSYPVGTHGGNQRQRYADTEVVRARPQVRAGIQELGQQAWSRYQIPIALTEVHLHCTREEQMRWWKEIWTGAKTLCAKNVPVVAVTAWSLLGAYDWDSLLTRQNGHYEPGVFEVKGPQFRKTALAALIAACKKTDAPTHPLLEIKGWWHGPQWLADTKNSPRLLIIGLPGDVEEALTSACRNRGILFSHRPDRSAADQAPGTGYRSPEFWSVIEYVHEEETSFYTDRMEVHAHPNAALSVIADLILNLVIDEVDGYWQIDESGAALCMEDYKNPQTMVVRADQFTL